jgi:hypothetical protein
MFRILVSVMLLAFAVFGASAQAYVDLHDFGGTTTNADGDTGPDGGFPYGGVAFDTAGNMYGTAYNGGANGYGMVWELTSTGAYRDIHDFGGTVRNANGTNGPDGFGPEAPITVDSKGNLYGTTSEGGPYDKNNSPAGIVWKITNTGTYATSTTSAVPATAALP